jgi:Xaa-Pro aminopeptidase
MLQRLVMPVAEIPAAALAARRTRVLDALGDGVLLLAAAPERMRSNDVAHRYRQDSDFGYVTGFPEPDAVCLLAPGDEPSYVLFVQPNDPERAIWVGARAGVDGAIERYGAAAAYPLADLEKELPRWLGKTERVYLALGREDPLPARLLAAVRHAQVERPRVGRGLVAVHDASDLLHELRLVKEPGELALMRQAIGIACEAHREAMQAARPGMHEFELEALVDYTFRRQGATGPAYPSIIAGGPNATILHYTDNAAALSATDLLLIDAGAEYAGYCADVTRTFPVGPRFDGARRDCYEAVLAAQTAAIAAARPGATLVDLHARAVRTLAERLVALGLLGGSVEQALEQETYKRFYMHRTSHWLGRDVHDVGRYRVGDTPRALVPGMVFTVEPGLYVAPSADVPEAFRGIGIRIEDDVLVTADGCEVLSAAAPKTIADVEALRAGA